MTNELEVRTERVDDIPLLLTQLQKMGVAEQLDERLERHGNREGLSPGELLMVWLAFIVSEGDHRMNQLGEWAAERCDTLSGCLGKEVKAQDCHIARLSTILETLAEDEVWVDYEDALNRRSIRAYELSSSCVRIDMTTASSYGEVDSEGMLRFGHSKDHRPDLPQVKVSVATLDPLGMPLASDVVAGNKADDPLYLPAVARIRASVGRRGLLYVGDSKLSSVGNRAGIAIEADYYLCPLSAVQVSAEQMLAYVQPYLDEAQERDCDLSEVAGLERVTKDDTQDSPCIAYGFELGEEQQYQCTDGEMFRWKERRIVSYSLSYAQAQRSRLETRLASAEQALLSLTEGKQGKRYPKSREEVETAVEEVLEKYKLQGLLHIEIQQQQQTRQVRAYAAKPARRETTLRFHLHVTRDEAALKGLERRLGWRVFVTNQPAEQLPLAQVIRVYRQQHRVESGIARLKGRPLALTPMFLQRDDHIRGLIHLLSIALRVLTLTEHVVREALAAQGEELQGLYAGQPKRSTARPRAETLLAAFKGITLSIITLEGNIMRHITDLSPPQQRILDLLGFPKSIYDSLTAMPLANV